MFEEVDDRADSFRVWRDGEPLYGSLCSKCLEFHGLYAPCIPSSLPIDAASFCPRAIKSGMNGSLSLHDYRKYLSQSAECIDDPVDRSEKTLKRKTAKSNLSPPPPLSSFSSRAASVSSTTSSPPPLSPSRSHSVISHLSEQESEPPEKQHQEHASQQSPRVHLVSENATRPRPNRRRLNTFREKLQARGKAQKSPHSDPEKPDPMLANTEALATISLGGASFEILNPRKSLDMARIVSFTENADTCSLLSIRDSKVSSKHFSLDQGPDRSSISQFTDVSLPSHYSSQSLYTTLPESNIPQQKQTADIPSWSSEVHDPVRSLTELSLHEHDGWSQGDYDHDEQAYPDLIEDSPKPRMPSISEHIDEENHDRHSRSQSQSPRRPSSSQPTFYSEESDIGEPGSPVYANGEWAQVDERDRGIFLDFPSPTDPYNTYYTSTMSDYAETSDPYDTIGYLDPHVQSVLAAANAENMGLRGNPARGENDLPRKYHASISTPGPGVRTRVEGPKQSFSQRKRLRKLFSWRSGN